MLARVSALHDLASDWSAERRLVEHAGVETYSAAVSALLKGLGEQADEDYWAELLRPLRRLRWLLATTPVPIGDATCEVAETLQAVVRDLRLVRDQAPGLARPAAQAAEAMAGLGDSQDDPLGDALRGLQLTGTVALLLPDNHAAARARATAALEGAEVVTPRELLRGQYGTVVAFGPTAWFPEPVLRAPRARRLVFLYYGWIRDREPQLELLTGNQAPVHNGLVPEPPRSARLVPELPDPEEHCSPEEWIPQIDWAAVLRAASSRGEQGVMDPVHARLFVLACGDGLYLEERDGTKAYVADIDEGEVAVRQEAVSALTQGSFVVTRTAGEGDYIRELADRELGKRARHLRELQAGWKRKLRDLVEARGARAIAYRLQAAGSQRADESNVRRWASAEGIRTAHESDFDAICSVIGEPDPGRLWQAMGELDKAHKRAGQLVRRLLLEEIAQADHAELLKLGWADFDVEEIDGEGALRVSRIAGKAPELTAVARTQLRTLFPLEAGTWQE